MEEDMGRTDGDRSRLVLSRRGLLAASGVAVAGVGVHETVDAATDPTLADIVVNEGDLRGPDAYVEWGVDPAEAELTRYLRGAVGPFAGRGGAARGFVSDGTPGLPRYVESAAFPAAGEWAAITGATADWFAGVHDATPTVDRREPDRMAWRVAAGEGLVDAVRLDRVDDLVAITIVGGSTEGVGPRTAVRRYGTAVRNRARSR